MENYICINGKKAELTEEQMKALGIELPKENPFEERHFHAYYYINSLGKIEIVRDEKYNVDRSRFEIGNYCNNKPLIEQRALHETLNRLLWRYAIENGGEGNYEVCHNGEKFIVQNAVFKYLGQTFSTYKMAEAAIKEIVEPFMKAHPEFKW